MSCPLFFFYCEPTHIVLRTRSTNVLGWQYVAFWACNWCWLGCHLITFFSQKNIFLTVHSTCSQYSRLSISQSKYNIFLIFFFGVHRTHRRLRSCVERVNGNILLLQVMFESIKVPM